MDVGSRRQRTNRSKVDVPADEIAVVEAAYRLDGTEAQWLEGLARAASSQVTGHCGVAAVSVHVDPAGPRLRKVACSGGRPTLPGAVTEYMRLARPEVLARTFGASPCTTIGAVLGEDELEADPASRVLFDLGIRDAMGVVALDPAGFLVVLATYFPKATTLSRTTVSRWSRVASHLAAGFRVRRGLQAAESHAVPTSPVPGCEAVLSPNGRLEHAEPAAQRARAALARAVLNIQTARGPLRREDRDGALQAWQGLVAGRWSLVDHVDTDGKRFLVARKNDSAAPQLAGVSALECRVLSARARGLPLKLIAYDLGLSMSCVSKHLHAGMHKLGVSHDGELAILFNGPSTDG
jgi:DNA-binding CsgD family transcriptional regulator